MIGIDKGVLHKLVSSNKEDIRDACERISDLVTYFRLAIKDGDLLTPALNNTIDTLVKYVSALYPKPNPYLCHEL